MPRKYHAKTLKCSRLFNKTRLNVESLEDRRLLTGLSLISFANDPRVVAFASAEAPLEDHVVQNFGTTQASAIANAGGALAQAASVAGATVSVGSAASLGVYGNTLSSISVVPGVGQRADAGDHEYADSASNADAEVLVECDGLLHVLMSVELRGKTYAASDGAPVTASAAGELFGSVAINNGVPVGSVHAEGNLYSTDTIDTFSFTADATGPDGSLPQIVSSGSAPPAQGLISAMLSFTVVVSAGDVITLDGHFTFDATTYGRNSMIGWTFASASMGGGLGISLTLECLETPPPPPPPLWSGITLPGGLDEGFPGGGGDDIRFRYGDFDGDGDMDDADVAIYVALLRVQTPLVVTTADDELDDPVANPAGYSFGDLSLREALALAADSNHPGEDTIGFAPWVDKITLAYDGADSGVLPDQLTINSDVKIVGLGADRLTIDGNDLSRLFWINPGVEATISGVTLTGGQVTGNHGGAIYNSGELTLQSVEVVDNQTDMSGGGVYVNNGILKVYSSTFDNNRVDGPYAFSRGGAIAGDFPAGTSLVIENSTFSNNVGDQSGGGIVFKAHPTLSTTANITNSTFSGNSALNGSAILTLNATAAVNLLNSTITNNTAGARGAIYKAHGASSFVAQNSIIAQNIAADPTYQSERDIAGGLWGSTYNVIGLAGTSGLTNTNGNQVGTATELDAKLAPLGDYGGKTKTHALKVGSPALNASSDSLAPAFDQRGEERPTALGGEIVDIGAFEAGDFTTLTVRTDEDRLNPALNPDDLSLREALAFAESLAGEEAIIFNNSLFNAGRATIVVDYDGIDADSLPDSLLIQRGVTLQGPGASLLEIQGTGQNRVFDATLGSSSRGSVLIEGVTISGGGGVSHGGGIKVNTVDLTVRRSRIVGNSATSTGGGLYSNGFVRLVDCEVSDNNVAVNGGGMAIYDTKEGAFEILNSTISGNDGGNEGGGVYVYSSADEPAGYVIVNSTITDNSAVDGAGIWTESLMNTPLVLLRNSIVADNVGNDIGGENLLLSSSYNLLRSGTSGGLTSTNSVGNTFLTGAQTARLKALDYYGGTTRTHVPYSDSAAIDAGDDAIAALYGLDFDQRGFARPVDWDLVPVNGIETDIGAVELAFVEEYN